MYIPSKGDIVAISFDPSSGKEIQKRRPALVISTKRYSELTNLAFVCPITHASHNCVKESGLLIPIKSEKVDGYVNPLQCHTFDYCTRKMHLVGKVNQRILNEVIQVINDIVNAKELN